MSIEEVASDLKAHEVRSQERYEELCKKLEVNQMSTEPVSVKNIFETNPMASMMPLLAGGGLGGAGAGAGAGLGAGLLGGILGGALLGGNGVLGGRGVGVGVGGDVGGIVTPALLAASLATNQNAEAHNSIMQSLGDIKGAIPLAEGQVQLALAGGIASLQSTLNTNNTADALASSLTNANIANSTATTLAGQVAINKGISDAIAASLASQNNINSNVLQTAALTQAAILNSKFELTREIRDDGDKTRALIIAQNDAVLNRELTVAQSALLEARSIGREQNNSVNVTQTVNQNQQQLQAQQQQQQFAVTLAHLCSAVNGLQVATATNANLIIGNSGATTTGAQTAAPVNVRA